jgi:decaprenyl-phosphate phosphoribosyltransferase
MNILAAIKLLRLEQYVKNLFIFLPIFFGLKISNLALVVDVSIAFIAFSLTSSAVYIFNDYFDVEDDKLHPKKKNRPLASGAISNNIAFILMGILAIVGITLMSYLSFTATGILLVYLVLNIAYSVKLKHIVIVDIFTISIGFVLRLVVGSTLTNTPLSMWIVIMTFLLTTLIALGKRHNDIILLNQTGYRMRKVIDGYSQQFIEISMIVIGSITLLAYIIFSSSYQAIENSQSEYLYLTSLFVIIGVLRYLYITFVREDSGSPTKILFTDIFIQLTILGWIISLVWILY